MDCHVITNSNMTDDNIWNVSDFNENITFEMPAHSPEQELYINIEEFLYNKVILVICIFGLLGNILNLVVLTRKSLSTHMDRMEKSAHMGLIALAISDLLFCLCAFPHSLQQRDTFSYDSISFWLLYELYGNAFINIFIMASTWLTVAMAVSRYLAICYPMRGREVLGVTFSRISIVCVFVFCILFNLPRFWKLKLDSVECEGGWSSYYATSGPMQQNQLAETVYMWFYFIFCILVPLVVLAYCNMYLIRALQISAKMRRQHTRGRDTSSDSKNIVTLTLTIIVIFYILLVAPAEILNFGKYRVITSVSILIADRYNLAVAFCNTLQALNFACNFVLYCIINVHFRRAVKQLFGCQQTKRKLSRWSMKYESVTGSTMAYGDNTSTFPASCTRV